MQLNCRSCESHFGSQTQASSERDAHQRTRGQSQPQAAAAEPVETAVAAAASHGEEPARDVDPDEIPF